MSNTQPPRQRRWCALRTSHCNRMNWTHRHLYTHFKVKNKNIGIAIVKGCCTHTYVRVSYACLHLPNIQICTYVRVCSSYFNKSREYTAGSTFSLQLLFINVSLNTCTHTHKRRAHAWGKQQFTPWNKCGILHICLSAHIEWILKGKLEFHFMAYTYNISICIKSNPRLVPKSCPIQLFRYSATPMPMRMYICMYCVWMCLFSS